MTSGHIIDIIFHKVNKYIYIKKYNMQFQTLRPLLKNLPAFTLNDVRKLDPGFFRQQLTSWLERGYIKPIAGGYYTLPEQEITEDFLLMMANRLYEPSYISLESVLARHQVIPETVLGVTSVSSRRTREIESAWGTFNYRSVQPHLMFGYDVVEIQPGLKYKLAVLGKAVLDYLYLNPGIQSKEDFEGLRWNGAILRSVLANERFEDYLAIFDKQALHSRVDILRRYINA